MPRISMRRNSLLVWYMPMMFDSAIIDLHFSRAAAAYNHHAALQHSVRAEVAKLVQNYAPEALMALDLGCGTGLLAEALPQYQWLGVDVALGMCHQARHSMPNVQASAALMPFADAQFSLVVSSLMLQWAPPEPVFAEVARLLKTGAVAVFSTLGPATLQELRTAFAVLDTTPHGSEFMGLSDVLALAQKAGLACIFAKSDLQMAYHADLRSVMQSLKAIGASNKHVHRKRGLMTPRQLQQLTAAYAYQTAGLPVSWEIFYLVVQKS